MRLSSRFHAALIVAITAAIAPACTQRAPAARLRDPATPTVPHADAQYLSALTGSIRGLAGDTASARKARVTEQLPAPMNPGRHRVEIVSSVDRTRQPSYITVPAPPDKSAPTPLVVVLHTWSFDLEQRQPILEAEVAARGWLLLAPNFRGRNDRPEACGSAIAQQDVLDAVEWVRKHYAVDERRIYVLGMSGGGYMTMLMAARHPDLWAAASAWVGISDLVEWYASHGADNFGLMMRGCFGAAPDQDRRADAEAKIRSPVRYLSPTLRVPLELAAGRFDSTVRVTHSLRAMQAIAPSAITDDEISQLASAGPGLLRPAVGDTASDPLLTRRIFLRRSSGRFRVTIFDGGHEWLPLAAVDWLARHRKP